MMTCWHQATADDTRTTKGDRDNRRPTPITDGAERDTPNDLIAKMLSDPDLYTISHDLKNRLALIKGWADLLQRRIVTDLNRTTISEAVAKIQSSAQAMDEHLSEILETARGMASQREQLMRSEIDLWKIAEQLVEQYGPLAKDHELIVVGSGTGQVVGNWDARSVERIVANLLSNALKYSPAGGPVMIIVTRESQEARIGVLDHGIGISEQVLPHIFEQFYRGRNGANQSESSDVSGVGLGLFAAQRLAGQLEGRIEVTSRMRQGSTFTLVLPLQDVQATRSGG